MDVDNQKTLLEIDLDLDALNSSAATAKQKVADLATQLKALQAAGKSNTAEYIALSGQMKTYQLQVTQAVNVNKQLTQAQNVASGSIDEMRANLSVITRQYNSLSAAQRDNADIGGKLLTSQKQLSDSLKSLETAGGNSTRSVGGYEEAIKNALAGSLPFSAELSEVARLFNSLSVATDVSAASQAEAAVATANLAIANEAVAASSTEVEVAQAAQVEAQTALNVLQETGTASAAELAAAQEALAAASAETAAAQEAMAGATTEAAAAQTGAAAATEAAAGGFKLLNVILEASIIGAIVAVIILLINYLRTFKPLVDLVEKAFAGLNGAVQFIVGTLVNAIAAFKDIGNVMSNIGAFFEHPVDSIKAFGDAVAQAAKDSYNLKEAQIELEDAMKASDVQTADSAQKTSALILAARNKSLSVADRKALLDQAAAIDKASFDARVKLANQEIANALEQARIEGMLTKQQLDDVKKNGVSELVALQELDKAKGKITDDTVDAYKKAQLDLIAVRQDSTTRQEKIQNKIDQDADRAEKAEEARQAKLKTLHDEAQKQADLATQANEKRQQLTESGREAEIQKLNIHYDKRVQASRGFAATIKAIEAERVAAIAKLHADFAAVDLKNQNEIDNSIIKGVQDTASRELAILKQSTSTSVILQTNEIALLQKLHDATAEQNAENQKFDLAQKDLTGTQIEAINEKYRQLTISNDADFEQQRTDINKDFSERRIEQTKKEKDATTEFEKAKRDAASDTLGVIQTIFGKNSAISKAALILQKALAISEVFIQTQKQVAAIELAAAYATAQAILVTPFPFFIPVVAGLQATAQARVVLAEVQGAIQIAGIIAQTVAAFATGGIFYNSDGKGGVLPGYSKKDNVNAHLRQGEGIVVSEAMRDPQARSVVSAVNVAYGGRAFHNADMGKGFATGGIFGFNSYSSPNNVLLQRQLEAVATRVAQSIPRQILVLEDVNAALQDKAYIDSKANI